MLTRALLCAAFALLLAPSAHAAGSNQWTPGPMHSSAVADDGTPLVKAGVSRKAHAATVRDYGATFACWRNSLAGVRLWTYKSRWTWTGSNVTRDIWKANHSEFTGTTAWFWEYKGSSYLWPSGGIGEWYIGRATQGHYKASAGVGPITITNNDYPILNVHVHWDGTAWWDCSNV